MIAVPRLITPIQVNPNPDTTSVAVTVATTDRPSTVPYIGHWAVDASFDAVQWYQMQWNEHIILGYNACIYFNDVLDVLADT